MNANLIEESKGTNANASSGPNTVSTRKVALNSRLICYQVTFFTSLDMENESKHTVSNAPTQQEIEQLEISVSNKTLSNIDQRANTSAIGIDIARPSPWAQV